MMTRKFVSAVIAFAITLSIIPAAVFAVGTEQTAGEVFLDKDVILQDDGSYKITMSAFATGTTTTQTVEKGVPLDIVLVIDQSGSLKDGEKNANKLDPLKKAVSAFISSVQTNGQTYHVTHRIGMAGFASNAADGSSDTSKDKGHPIAGGSESEWVNTGIWDANGDFKNYQVTVEAGKDHYARYNDRPLDVHAPADTYYVNLGTRTSPEFYPLTFTPDGSFEDKYLPVINPATTRTDLYGLVNGSYQPASYGSYEQQIVASNPVKGDGKTYYDANGNKLIWKEIVSKPGSTTYVPIQEPIQENKTYWIKFANGSYHSISFQNGKWTDDEGSDKYKVNADNQSFHWPGTFIFGVEVGGLNYEANSQIITPDEMKTVLTDSSGKEYTGVVYILVQKTGWHVGNTPVDKLFEKKVSENPSGTWTYQKSGKQTLKDTDLVSIKLTASSSLTAADYQGALVPVSDGPDGSGALRGSLTKAVDHLGASGATRMATGIEMGNEIFRSNPLTEADKKAGRKRIMIIFTDGEPGFSSFEDDEANKALAESVETKGELGATVYTVGTYTADPSNTKRENLMNRLSSNYSDGKFVYKEFTGTKDEAQTYYILKNGQYLPVSFYEDKKVAGQKLNGWYYEQNGTYTKLKREKIFQSEWAGTPAAEQKYYKQVAEADSLNSIFQTIQGEITSSTTSVDLTATSILRDIMSKEGFELTDASVVTVQIVPGDATNAADPSGIVWGKPVEVLRLDHPTDGKKVQGTYGKMTIQASTYMTDPTTGEPTLHTVDVTGFDYKDQYIAKKHKGAKLVAEITGVKALSSVATDHPIYTNHEQSGIWAPKSDTADRTLTAPFPKRPETYLSSQMVVLDYAKPSEISLSDLKMDQVLHADGNGYLPFQTANKKVDQAFGSLNLQSGSMTYAPTTMNWNGTDTFYAFGKTTNAEVTAASANRTGNMWSKVTVIPANNVYYEDSFVSIDQSGNQTGLVGITYNGNWTEVQSADPNSNQGKPENKADPEDNHGWIPVLKTESGDTDGSSHRITAIPGQTASASFTFTGTGVDLYSRTNSKTGVVLAILRDENTGKDVLIKIMDTLSASGEYYQVPTLNFHKDGNGNPLPYSTYSVRLFVTSSAKDRCDYFLDGIRVYNPLDKGHAAYGDKEMNASFMEVRDLLLDANSFSAEDGVSHGFVFIDQMKPGETAGSKTDQVKGLGTYEDLGPKNEVYLKPFQSVSFKVNMPAGTHLYVGMKALGGQSVTASFPGADGSMQMVDIAHTADMFYEVGAASSGVVTISNMGRGNAILSITKLKTTNPAAPVHPEHLLTEAPVNEVLAATNLFLAPPAKAPVTPPVSEHPVTPALPVSPEHQLKEENNPAVSGVFRILDRLFSNIYLWFR